MNWIAPRIWEGGDVFIIGGGPSLTRQFDIPNSVVQAVIKGQETPAAYSEYMKCLHDKHVIGINVAYMIGNWIDIVFFGDIGFFLEHADGLSQFEGIKCTCHREAGNNPWVKFLAKDRQKRKGISDNPKMVCWNDNSGSAAISIAANMGAKRIILLGFDMKLDNSANQHWHDVYKRNNVPRNPKKPFQLPFPRHMIGFQYIVKDAARRGIQIFNCSDDSAIKEFPKVNLKDIL